MQRPFWLAASTDVCDRRSCFRSVSIPGQANAHFGTPCGGRGSSYSHTEKRCLARAGMSSAGGKPSGYWRYCRSAVHPGVRRRDCAYYDKWGPIIRAAGRKAD
jgi:hypothetical protein